MTPTRFAVVSLWAADVPTTAHFYRDVLGLPLMEHHHGGYPHFDIGGVYLTIRRGQPAPAQPERFPVVALAVADLDAMLERLRAHHTELPYGVESNSASRWVMFPDPAGNLIELVQFG